MAFRFVHTADLHLDSPLRSLALRDAELAELIGGASRMVLERIVDLCLAEAVDALVIAGDLWDGDQRSVKTTAFFAKAMARLQEAGIAVYIIKGNHDASAKVTRHADLPPNVHLFSVRGDTVRLDEAGVAVHGVSFRDKQGNESLLPRYPTPVEGLLNIGLLHTSLSGAEGHEPYAPCSLTDLTGFGYDYWALGHVHKRQVHHEAPCVVMPGMPQGRDIGEEGAKSVTLVTMDQGPIRLEERVVSLAEFVRAELDIGALGDWHDLESAISAALLGAREMVQSDHAVVRLRLNGAGPLAWRIRRDRELLMEHAMHSARALKTIWMEKIETGAPGGSARPDRGGEAGGPVDELDRLMAELMADPGCRREAGDLMDQLVKDLPPEVRDRFGEDEDGREEILGRLLTDGLADVSAVLRGS
ncbi:MAG: exonuclease SbcCD subunit D [Alphaproteobacteria bacterium]